MIERKISFISPGEMNIKAYSHKSGQYGMSSASSKVYLALITKDSDDNVIRHIYTNGAFCKEGYMVHGATLFLPENASSEIGEIQSIGATLCEGIRK